jgi:nucleotidyltransferase domain
MYLLKSLDSIICLIKENQNFLSLFTEVYIFGSVLNNSKYRDIDILLIYENVSPKLLSQKKKLEYLGKNKLGCSLDITMLSCSEEKEVRFLERLDSRYIKIK